MRSIFYSLLSLATIASTLAVDSAIVSTAKRANTDDEWEDKVPDTIFNGQTVPPMPVLDIKSLEKSISHGNWCVICMHMLECLLRWEQARRVLLTLMSSLQAICTYLPDSLRVLLYVEAD